MRSALAVLTAVAFLANAPLANAAGASPTKAMAGDCPWWSSEPALLDLGDIVDDADCTSAEAVVLDPRVVTNVIVLPEYTGPRAMGAPSGTRTIIDVRWSDPYVATGTPGERILLLDVYDSYKGGLASWRATTQIASEAAGSAHATWFSVGPTWMRNVNGASTATAGIVAGDMVSNGAATLLFPFIGVAAFLPSVESFAGEVRDAPAHVGSGASEAWTGAKAGRFDQAAEGVAEVCGGVGVLASVAVPFAKGASALSVRTAPVTLFPKGVPVVEPSFAPVVAMPAALPRILVTEALIREKMRGAPLSSQQRGGVSLPKVQEYVDRLQAGEKAPPIKVDGNMIVDGNHRYIADRIVGTEPEIQPWAGGRPTAAVSWEEIPISELEWPQ